MNIKTTFIILLLFSALAVETTAQGSRIMLTQLERAPSIDGSRRGMIGLSNANGDQRYAFYVNVADTCINYTPADTGNVVVSIFAQKCATDSIWYIDFEGRSILLAPYGAGSDTCDTDFLQISDNSCPDALTDSLYKYKYLSVGARYVFPGAELLVNDSSSSGIAVVQGFRNSRLALVDGNAGNFLMIDHGSNAPVFYLPVNANLTFKTTAGTPQTPVGSQVNHFGINAQDSTIQAFRYPNTRTDTQSVVNFIYTDQVGKFRSRPVTYLEDSLGFGFNIYNSDGFFPPDNTRNARLDSATTVNFLYPNGSTLIEIYGGDDSLSTGGFFYAQSPSGLDYITVIEESITANSNEFRAGDTDLNQNGTGINISDSDSYIKIGDVFGGDNSGFQYNGADAYTSIYYGSQSTTYVHLGDNQPVFVGQDIGIGWRDTKGLYIHNESQNEYISQNAETFNIRGGSYSQYLIDADSSGNVLINTASPDRECEITVGVSTGVDVKWTDGTEFSSHDEQNSSHITQSASNLDIAGGVYANYTFAADTVGEIMIRSMLGEAVRQAMIILDAQNGGDNYPILTISAYDPNAPQYTLNEISIDTAGVSINTRGGVGNSGEVLFSNGEKCYWAPPGNAVETLYSASGTIADPDRTVSVAEDGYLQFLYNNDSIAIDVDDFGDIVLKNKDGESKIEVGTNHITLETSGTAESVNISATGNLNVNVAATVALCSDGIGTVAIGAPGSPVGLYFHDAGASNYATTIYAGTQTENIDYVLPLSQGIGGQFLKNDGTGNLSWDTSLPDGVLSADQISWTGGGTWIAVNANRALFAETTGATPAITPSVGVTEIIVDDTATTSTVNLNYVPGELDAASYAQPYTTVRYIYNWGSGDCTVDTNQDWLFRTQGAGAGATTLTIPTGQAYKLVWIQGSSEANSRFWCFRLQ